MKFNITVHSDNENPKVIEKVELGQPSTVGVLQSLIEKQIKGYTVTEIYVPEIDTYFYGNFDKK